jgi:hypothetical protein
MTIETTSKKATEAVDLQPQETTTPTSTNNITGDPCPSPDAIIAYLLNVPGFDPTVEQHLKDCADCRLEYDALTSAIRSTCSGSIEVRA